MACALTRLIESTTRRCLLHAVWLLLGMLMTLPAPAHEGEVHDEAPPPVPGQATAPRFATAGGEVEVVGVLDEGQLWLYVARFATNAPWSGLRVEVEHDSGAVRAAPVAEGVYRVAAGSLAQVGRHTVVMTLQGEGLDELLTAQLVVADAVTQDVAPRGPWRVTVMALLAAAFALHLLHALWVRRRLPEAPRG